jgi:hypothetical protein
MSSTITALTSGGGLAMAGDTSGQLELKTNNGTTAVTVTTAQNVGIGTTNPAAWGGLYKGLDINTYGQFAGSTGGAVWLGNNFYYDGSNYIYKNTAAVSGYLQSGGGHNWYSVASGTAGNSFSFSSPAMQINSSGDFLVGGTTTIGGNGILLANADYTATYRSTGTAGAYIHAFASDIGGTRTVKYAIYANGTAGAVSDQNLKKNIEPARGYLADLMNIEVVKYNWKSDEENAPKELGYIAQQVETVFAGMVDEQTYDDGDGNSVTQKMLKKEVFIPMMLKAIQELNAKVDAQALEIQALKGVA